MSEARGGERLLLLARDIRADDILPHISHLAALAIHMQELVDRGEVAD